MGSFVNSSIQFSRDFPYLSDRQIRDLHYIDFELTLQSVGANVYEIFSLKLKRKRLKKCLWKQNHDTAFRIECQRLEAIVERLIGERNDLCDLKESLIAEMEHYKRMLQVEPTQK